MTTLDNLQKAAKRWLKSLRDGDPDARERLRRAHPVAPEPFTLRDVQHALARERGHESWIALTRAAAAASRTEPLGTLLAAADQGDVAAIAALLDEHPALVNERGTLSGHTGLRTALHFGVHHEPVVRALIERGADPNIRDEGDHAYPLHFAAERGDLPVVKLLIEHGADPIGAGTDHELDVLGWAVCFDYATNLEVAHYLLAHGARHTLLSAVAMGDTDAIRDRARAGDDLNQRMDRTNHRRTPPHLAIVKHQPAALATLIELAADLNIPDAVGLTPLDQAALNGEDEMTRMLLDAGAAITLPSAIALERPDEVERLVREQPDALSMTSEHRWARLLIHASRRASGRVIEALLATVMRYRAGLSVVNVADDMDTSIDGTAGYTALHSAAFHGNNDAVAVLLRHGANPRLRDGRYCGTPAGWAAFAGHMETANRILEADIDIFDAISFDRDDLVQRILDRDPAAIDRPFKAYGSCPSGAEDGNPSPDSTPLEWATAQEKTKAIHALTERDAGARSREAVGREARVAEFLTAACWDHQVHGKAEHRMFDRAAQRMLARDPSIARDSIYTAIVSGDLVHVETILAADPDAARQAGGPREWSPLLYLAYTRFHHPATIEHAIPIARALLDRGANPNDFYMAGDARYTVLTGVAGEGEQDSPRQPYAAELLDLLLERGAEPFDVQILYNTHFSGDILWWLEVVYRRTIDTDKGPYWADPEWKMFDMGAYGTGARFLLETAQKTRNLALAEWCLAHGANPNSAPARDKRFPQRSLYEFAELEDYSEMAALLARYGAVRSALALNDHERFIYACFKLDREAARKELAAHPEYLRSPHAMFEAAKRDRPDVLALLLDLGTPLETQDWTGKRALHEAGIHNAVRAIAFLIERGAEIDPRESTYHNTPLGWAAHGDRFDAMQLLAGHSYDIWTLCFRGFVDRIRQILIEDPALAQAVRDEGLTPLWWLPDDEQRAMEIVELLIAAGTNPSTRNSNGHTAADWARRRGMDEVASRIERG